MELKIKKLHPGAMVPTYGTEGAACFDLYALKGGEVHGGEAATFRTGIAVEVPDSFAMMVYSRSSHGFKNGIRLANVVGVIDSDYRGEVMVRLHNDKVGYFYEVKAGERIAQAMLVFVPTVSMVEVGELGETQRGEGGFGSTGQ